MKILPILSAIVIAIGCLLPWMQIGPLFSYNGIDHPVGAFLLVASVISSGIAFQNYTLESPKNTWIYIVLGLFGLFTAFGALYEVSSKAEEMAEGMEQIGEFIGQKSNISSIKLIGAGIYIISFGSLGLILSGLGIFDFEKRLTNTSYIDQFNSEFKELSQTKKCPDCAETIKKDARICRFCQYKFSEDDISKIDNLVKIEIDRKGVHKLHSLVKIEKNKLFGGGMTEEIHLCMRNLFINTDDSIKILDIYYEISQTDFIEDLIEFESSYDKIKSYVSIFIELDIIEAKFPHKRLH